MKSPLDILTVEKGPARRHELQEQVEAGDIGGENRKPATRFQDASYLSLDNRPIDDVHRDVLKEYAVKRAVLKGQIQSVADLEPGLSEAIEIAANSPCAVAQGVVEVWPLDVTPEAEPGDCGVVGHA